MYTDISKLKKSDITIPKGSHFYLLKDGRLVIYSMESLNIYNILTYKIDISLFHGIKKWLFSIRLWSCFGFY